MKEGVGVEQNMKLKVCNVLNKTLLLGIILLMKMLYNNLKVLIVLLRKFSIRQDFTSENEIENFSNV